MEEFFLYTPDKTKIAINRSNTENQSGIPHITQILRDNEKPKEETKNSDG